MNNIIDTKKIGSRIQKARKKKGITQEQLCNDLNISLYHYSKIENGHVNIRLNTLGEISLYLDADLNEILLNISKVDQHYLNDELYDIFNKCTPKQKKMIIDISKIILNSDDTHD